MFWKVKNPDISGAFKILDPQEYKEAILGGDTQLIDVRTPREYQSGYIANAINIDIFRPGYFRSEVHKLDKNRPVYLYCRSGQRSRKAAHKLIKWGFAEIYDLEGGILNWK